jgi:hypothetical protein
VSVASLLYYFVFTPREAESSALFPVSNADGIATIVAVESAVAPVAFTGGQAPVARRWWMPFVWPLPIMRRVPRTRRLPRVVSVRAHGGAIIAGSAPVLCTVDKLTDEELLLLLELEVI